MAEKVALIEEEYNNLASGVKNVHEDCLTQMQDVIKEIEKLNSRGGGFYAKELTPKITAVIGQMNRIQSTLKGLYSTHERMIKSFSKVVDNYDAKL